MSKAPNPERFVETFNPHAEHFEYPFLERPFALGLFRCLDRNHVSLEHRRRVWTPAWDAPFVVDFALHYDGETIAYECDGTERDELRDAARDSLLLGSGKVVEVCRIRQGIIHRLDDVLYVLSCMHPLLYQPERRADLQHLASRYARAVNADTTTNDVRVFYPVPGADPDQDEAYDEASWEDGEARFDDPADPLRFYRGKRMLGLRITCRMSGYNIFTDHAASKSEAN